MRIRSSADVIADADRDDLRRVLVVTALPLEMEAVRSHTEEIGSCVGHDGTFFECGSFAVPDGKNWLVVVVETGAGNHHAHQGVTSAHREFGAFDLMLFVGVAASRKPEAPLGSVIASSIVYWPYGGKYQEGGFNSRLRVVDADNHLVNLARKVARDEQWQERIAEPVLPDGIEHPDAGRPSALVAPIVSVEAVSADPESELEKNISQFCGDAVGLEMEGYGSLFAARPERTPGILVRGVSDLRSGKTETGDVAWQPVAAAHAAAFAFEMIMMWGLVYERHPRPLVPSRNSVVDETSGMSPSADLNSSGPDAFVLNFNNDADDFPQTKLDEIGDALRSLTGNPDLEITRYEEGSFHLFVRGNPDDQRKIDVPETYTLFADKYSVFLVSVLSEQRYQDTLKLDAAFQRASGDLLRWEKSLPDGTRFVRPEIEHVISTIDETEASTTVVLGPPGSGKSAFLSELGERLIASKTQFLAIKGDHLDPNVSGEEDLQEFYSLPAKPSEMIEAGSRLRPQVLIIDQLDALAGYTDLQTSRLNILLNLVRKLGGMRNVHIVLSARDFEYRHDARLRSIDAESLLLELPPWSAVLETLEKNGVEAAGWPENAKNLIRSPQALSIYLNLSDCAERPPFGTYQAMLNQLWTERILQTQNGPGLAAVATDVAALMAEREALWIPCALFDDHAKEISALEASGILSKDEDGGRIGFTHQTIFDHVLARSFARSVESLSTYVLQRQSSLFVRPKLWTALTYLRAVDIEAYHSELKKIWAFDFLRLHLKRLMIEFMGQQARPSQEEVTLIEAALSSDERGVTLRAVLGSEGWFQVFRQTHIPAAMTDPAVTGLALAMLEAASTFKPEEVLHLVKEQWLPSSDYDRSAWVALQSIPEWTPEVIAVAKQIYHRTKIEEYWFDQTISMVGVEQPSVALELARYRLDTDLDRVLKDTETLSIEGDEFNTSGKASSNAIVEYIETLSDWETLPSLAEENGFLFLESIWPWFERVFAELRKSEKATDGHGFSIPFRLHFEFEDKVESGVIVSPLLTALSIAMESLASGDQEEFLSWMDRHEKEDAEAAQRLFAHALATKPESYHSRALRFLLDDERRFFIGSSQDSLGATKSLVSSVSPFWSKTELVSFLDAIMSLSPRRSAGHGPENRRSFHRFVRRTKLALLQSMPREKLSEAAMRLVNEEERRFPRDTSVNISRVVEVASPMTSIDFSRASDADILSAFKKIPDAAGWDHPKDWSKGGNVQLSRAFAEFAEADNERACSIMERFEPDFGTRASAYAIRGMADAGSGELVTELIKTLDSRGFYGEEFRTCCAWAVSRLHRRAFSIDEQLVDLLERWLRESEVSDPEPELTDESWEDVELTEQADEPASDDREENWDCSSSVLWGMGGARILPGGNFPILDALTEILLGRDEHDRILEIYANRLEAGESQETWVSLLHLMHFIHPTDPGILTKFLSSLFSQYSDLAKTREGALAIARVQWFAPQFVREMATGWQHSDESYFQQLFGEIVGLVALTQPEQDWAREYLRWIVKDGSGHAARVGACNSAVNLWSNSDYRAEASSLIQTLIPSADEQTWKSVFDLFRIVDGITPEPAWIGVLNTIAEHIDSVANVDATFVVQRLLGLLPHEAATVGRIATGLVTSWRDDLGDIRTGASIANADLTDLAITLHRLGEETREVGIALFEELLKANVFEAKETLDQVDNRFKGGRRSVRRRLPRRLRRPRGI